MQPALRRAAAMFLCATAAAAAGAEDPNLARNLAATCANCHGTNGQARAGMRPLAGVAAQEMLARLAEFRSGAQQATVMRQITMGYTDEQLRLLAAFFAAQPAGK